MSKQDSYNIDQARYEEQKTRMQSLSERKVCFLCEENVERETGNPILTRTEHWYIKNNDYPYEGTKSCFLLVSKSHVAKFDELDEAARKDYGSALASAVSMADNPSAYSVAMRNGALELTGGTVGHLHAHVLVPDENYDKQPSIKVKLMVYPKHKP